MSDELKLDEVKVAKPKLSKKEKAAKRTRGNFLGVYQPMTASAAALKLGGDQMVYVRLVTENAACTNHQEAKAEAAKCGCLGEMVALRRCGSPWQRVEQIVLKDVDCEGGV